jgi:hypothetical protein
MELDMPSLSTTQLDGVAIVPASYGVGYKYPVGIRRLKNCRIACLTPISVE